jgi:hypothetical protein
MARSTLFRSTLLILCLSAANLLAQEPSMIPPPIPSVIPPEPLDPDTLPPPPQLEWAPLPPKDSEDPGGASAVAFVPPPQSETAIPPPPPPVVETPLAGQPDPAEIELVKPEVEVWRPEGELPQIPQRQLNQLDRAYIAGTAPVALRVQFDPQAAGKTVYVRPGRGVTLGAAAPLTVSSSGECLLSAQLEEDFPRGHIIFYCEGVKTVLPLVRASLPIVEANEAATGGGE